MKLDFNWLAAVAACILLLSCYTGFRRGFIKEAISTFFLVLALVAVWYIHPYVDQFLTERTPIQETVLEGCQEALSGFLAEEEIPEEKQEEAIWELPLPELLKQGIAENNTEENYQALAAHTFAEYAAGYLARLVVSGIGFLISFLLAIVLIRIVVYTLDLVARLPVLRGINRLAGILVGGLKGLLVIWIACLVITVCWNTKWGGTCMEMIDESAFLSFLYENNVLTKLFMGLF